MSIVDLKDELQRSPSVSVIEKRLELEETYVLEVLEANHNRRPLSLDRPAGGEEPDESSPSEWIGSEDKGFEIAEGRIALDAAIPRLGEREQLVLRLRFVEDMTQTQIAERIGCSQMHVSRILRRTLQQLREQVEGDEPG
jgi:RNA polymerase sigma-B factor